MTKIFKAKASQQGEGNINTIIYANDAGISDFTRISVGQYQAVLPAGTTVEQDNFLYLITNGLVHGRVTAYMEDNTVIIASFDANNEYADDIINNATLSFEIILP